MRRLWRAGAPFHRVGHSRRARFTLCLSLWRIFIDYGSHVLTAFNYPFIVGFEWCAWRHEARTYGRVRRRPACYPSRRCCRAPLPFC